MAKNQGIKSRNLVHKPVRVGKRREHLEKAGIAQLGQSQGNRAMDTGVTRYEGIGLIGPKRPISEPLGNEVAARTVCKPGGSRTVYAHGTAGVHGPVNRGQSPERRDILSEYGPDSAQVKRRG
jgi:hypothetical protein